jgi:hypothetical protein
MTCFRDPSSLARTRIVLEVADTAQAYTTGEPKRIEIDAEPPALAAQARDQLAALGVKLERSGGKTRIVVEPSATRPCDRELFGTRVDIRQTDLDALSDRAGPLVVHIRPYRAAMQ